MKKSTETKILITCAGIKWYSNLIESTIIINTVTFKIKSSYRTLE